MIAKPILRPQCGPQIKDIRLLQGQPVLPVSAAMLSLLAEDKVPCRFREKRLRLHERFRLNPCRDRQIVWKSFCRTLLLSRTAAFSACGGHLAGTILAFSPPKVPPESLWVHSNKFYQFGEEVFSPYLPKCTGGRGKFLCRHIFYIFRSSIKPLKLA